MSDINIEGLTLLRQPFPAHQINKLPKPTKQQTDSLKADFKLGKRCALCGGWHQPEVAHLDYVGHAALTARLLDADIAWHWEPAAVDTTGHPILDNAGGMWIKLTVCGVTRLGYGHAGSKTGGDAIKEVIGDALRNAAMRFGAALDLWHKGDLHADEKEPMAPDVLADWISQIESSANGAEFKIRVAAAEAACREIGDTVALGKVMSAAATMFAKAKSKTKTAEVPV